MCAAPLPTFHQPRLLPLLGWLTGAVFFFYAWVFRVAPSVMVEELMRDFAVGGAVLGHLSAAYFYGYAGMQIPVGLLLDRFGPRRLMRLPRSSARAAACSSRPATRWRRHGRPIPDRRLGRLQPGGSHGGGRTVVSRRPFRGPLGPGDGDGHGGRRVRPGPAAARRRGIGLAHNHAAAGNGGVALALAAWATVRDRWRGRGGMPGAGGPRHRRAHRQTWLIALAGLGTSAPLLGFAGLWGVPFLEAAYGLPRARPRRDIDALRRLGRGAPLFGWLSDRIGRRKTPLLAGIALETVALAAIVYVAGLAGGALGGLCFATGFLGSAQIVGFALVKENHPVALSGTASGSSTGW